MRAHLANVEAQEAGCAALWSLAEADQLNNSAIRGTGAADVVCRAMEKHPRSIPLQAVGCSALLCFCTMGNSQEVAQAGGVEAVMCALRNHGTVIAIQECGIEAVAILARSSQETMDAVLEAGAVELVRAAMHTRFPQHEGIQRAGQQAMSVLPKSSGGLLG